MRHKTAFSVFIFCLSIFLSLSAGDKNAYGAEHTAYTQKIVQGRETTYAVYNKEAKENTVFFLHGLGGNHLSWEEYLYELCDRGFCVVAPDAYGHGASKAENTTIIEDVTESAKMLEKIIEAEVLQDSNLYLYGYSMGGMEAFYYTAFGKYPVKAVVSLCGTPDFAALVGRPLFYEQYRKGIVKTGVADTDRIDALMREADPLAKLLTERTEVSFYFFNGTEDPYMPIESVRRLHGLLPKAEFQEAEIGHVMSPDEFQKAIDWMGGQLS